MWGRLSMYFEYFDNTHTHLGSERPFAIPLMFILRKMQLYRCVSIEFGGKVSCLSVWWWSKLGSMSLPDDDEVHDTEHLAMEPSMLHDGRLPRTYINNRQRSKRSKTMWSMSIIFIYLIKILLLPYALINVAWLTAFILWYGLDILRLDSR